MYDARGRIQQRLVRSGSPLVLRRTVTYLFDAVNRPQSLADSVSGTLAYTYDDRFDSVRTETGPSGTMSYEYLANGLLDHATPSGGTRLTYGYDTANRLERITQAAGTGPSQPASAQVVQFTQDDAGRRSRLTLPNGITLDYGLDAADQLQTITYRQGATLIGDLVYGYDLLGRRTSTTGSFSRAELPPAVNLTVGADGRISHEDGLALGHDTNGRLTQDTQFNYVWNELGQLTEVRNRSDNALRASYMYDAVGRRIQKTMDGTTTRYLHDGANPIQLQAANGTPTEHLLAGGVDEWFSRSTGGQPQHFLTDALGSTLRLTSSTGAKVVDYSYDPYGGTTNDNAGVGNLFQYAGRENDGLGLYFNRARYLKSAWGRFISQDPIGLAGGDNLSSYVNGSPLGFTDPTGMLYVAIRVEFSNMFIVLHNKDGRGFNVPTYEGIFQIPNAPCNFLCLIKDKDWDRAKRESDPRISGVDPNFPPQPSPPSECRK